MIQHHPDELLLLDYASGALSEAEALVIATHAAFCPECRRRIAELETIGGAALESAEAASMGANALAKVMARIDKGGEQAAPTPIPAPKEGILVPRPLRDYLDAPLEQLGWKGVLPGLAECTLKIGNDQRIRTKLLRVQPKTAMPQHTHDDTELTLVLDGAFSDEHGYFGRGDFAITDADIDHRPVAEAGSACYCLTVTTAPLRLTGPLGRLINPFIPY
jgi:putative transcriptional regulator